MRPKHQQQVSVVKHFLRATNSVSNEHEAKRLHVLLKDPLGKILGT